MGKKHKKHKSDRHFYEGEERPPARGAAPSPPARPRPAEISPGGAAFDSGPPAPAGVRGALGGVAPALGRPRLSPRVLLLFQNTWRSP